MAKTTLPTNYVDDVLNGAMDGKRRYREIPNADGTISLEDATTYDQIGNNFGASQLNLMNDNINQSFDANKMLKTMDEVNAVEQEGYGVDALVVKQLSSSLEAKGDFELLCYATSVGDKTVPNLTQYKSIWAILVIDNSLNGNFLIPLSLFKTITTYSRCSYYESSGGYSCDFKYVNDTTIYISQIYRAMGCYLYGIK